MTDLPRLAIFQNQSTVSIFDLVGAAKDLCRIVWVVGWADAPATRVLERFGDVADVTGMSEIEMIEHLREFRLDGVAVFNDPPLVLAAVVAEGLGLRFHSPRTASILSDKAIQRQTLLNEGVPVPIFATVNLTDHHADVPFPAVLKPRGGAGARDTFLVHSFDDVAAALSKCEPSEEFILEEWLPDRTENQTLSADIISVESIALKGTFRHLMVTGRFPYAPPFRDTGGYLPSDLDPSDWESVCALAGTAARAVGIRDGIIHTEIKMTPSGPRVVEINGRLGGGISKLIERIGGPSLNSWVMRLALGHEVGTFPVLDETGISFFYFAVAPESAMSLETISGISELNEMKRQLGIDEIQVNVRPGAAVSIQQTSFTAYVVRIDGLVSSHQELAATITKIDETLQMTWKLS
jgi:predicted ATP-grasp superfamily ATP-dependent carboligase